MPNTYTLLEQITVGAAGASSVTFNSIPQTGYTDLVVRTSLRETSTNSGIALCKINAITSGYTGKQLNGNGASASSDSNYVGSSGFGMDGTNNPSSTTANTFSSSEWYFPNYTSSNYKSVSVNGTNEANATTAFSGLGAYLLSNTAAISSLTFSSYSGTFAQYSTFSLYGVSALGVTPTKAPKATGGSIIQTDGTYWYHAFLATGTFTPATALSCDVLVVAGGGGGAHGGGGAGGYRSTTGLALTSGSSNTVTVGAGGAGGGAGFSGGGAPTSGNDSIFNSITSTGGGSGAGVVGTAWGPNGVAGGSGGGAGGHNGGATSNGGSSSPVTSPVQGYAGGSSIASTSNQYSGGGGGAGAVGANAVNATQSGAGGAGSNAHSSWLSTVGLGVSGYLAGGGGGGNGGGTTPAGGAGGGGTGTTSTTQGVAGTANTGSGGGGGFAYNGANGAGGSGLVIIRYLAA